MFCNLFDWPEVNARNKCIVQPVTAICAFLRRLSTPTRWLDLEKCIGLFASQFSEHYWPHVELCVDMCDLTLKLRSIFLMDKAAACALTLVENGSPVESVTAFIDCTKIQLSRSEGISYYQRAIYSGHRRKHRPIYHSISTPDGLIAVLFSLVKGCKNDLTLFKHSGWEDILSEARNRDGRQFHFNGDNAYFLCPFIIRPFINAFANAKEMKFNLQRSSLRVLVEQNY